MHSTLVSTEQLDQAVRSAAPWIVLDCRFDLMRPEAGRNAYLTGHLPGAIYAHLEEDLSAAKTPVTGRHPLPEMGSPCAVRA